MAIKRIIPIGAFFIVVMTFTIAPALAFLQNTQNFHLADTYNNPHSLSGYSGNHGEAKKR